MPHSGVPTPVYPMIGQFFTVYVKHVNRDFKIQRSDGNENIRKGLISKTITSHVHRTFLYISLPFLHYYDVKMSVISRFMENVNKQWRNFISISGLLIWSLRIQIRRVRLHLTKQVGGNNRDKDWKNANSLLSNVLVTVASFNFKVPNRLASRTQRQRKT